MVTKAILESLWIRLVLDIVGICWDVSVKKASTITAYMTGTYRPYPVPRSIMAVKTPDKERMAQRKTGEMTLAGRRNGLLK